MGAFTRDSLYRMKKAELAASYMQMETYTLEHFRKTKSMARAHFTGIAYVLPHAPNRQV
jgi:hypothetical protein